MMVWCGAVDTTTSTYNAGANVADLEIDYNSFFGSGNHHGMCYPNPPSAFGYNPNWFANRISLGVDGPNGEPSSAVTGSVSLRVLQSENRDITNNTAYFGPAGGPDFCYMRFRHLNNTTTNALYCDGHVESKALGQVVARDICVNPQ
jgi:prepilin-type processing-associated H-X9-DG protein